MWNAKQLVLNVDFAAVNFRYLSIAIKTAEEVLLASEVYKACVLDV